MTNDDDRFRDLLALHLQQTMKTRNMTFEDVSEASGIHSRNYCFRASVGSVGKQKTSTSSTAYAVQVPVNLHKLLNFLKLEPRDFAAGGHPLQSGHLADVILCLADLPDQQKRQLLDVVNAFLQSAVRI